jgi:hypothetical protein
MPHPDTEKLAYQLWEEQGRPDGLHTDHWLEAERRLSTRQATPARGEHSTTDTKNSNETRNAPGKANPTSSRQQTVPDQNAQTGSPQFDRALSK